MPTIRNDAEWDMIIPMLINRAVNEVVEKALDLLKKEVWAVVYSYTPKTNVYTRSGEFALAWNKISEITLGKTTSIEFGYDPESMESIPADGTWQHGSYHWDGGTDSRDFLADFIFKGVAEYDSDGLNSIFGEIPARDAWTPFKAQFDASWETWWLTALKHQGLI